MRKGYLTSVVALFLVVAFTLVLAARANVVLVNQSHWDIYQLFLSPADQELWGPDQLGEHVLEAGGRFALQNIPCDDYDLKLVDQVGDVCIVTFVDVCQQETWVITNDDLLDCQGSN